MFKKRISCILVFAFACTLAISASACSGTQGEILPAPAMRSIRESFPDEISYIEELGSVDLTALSQEEKDLLLDIAVDELNNPDYRFGPLVDALSLAFATQNGETAARRVDIQNRVDTVYRTQGPLRGTHIGDITANTMQERSFEISINAGTEIKGAEIGVDISRGDSLMFVGPATNKKLPNDIYISHNAMIAVLYGTIMHTEYDLVTATGRTHVSYYYIPEETTTMRICELSAYIGTPTYVKHEMKQTVFKYDSMLEFYDAVEVTPELFVA